MELMRGRRKRWRLNQCRKKHEEQAIANGEEAEEIICILQRECFICKEGQIVESSRNISSQLAQMAS
ncbi:uncharacterized protein MONOS_18252 [Monocercomonoides exilis]|uniref:uncharacterized protein n=1 Tax=Monocercomonoides exilis TaxID=2049356 RepID=UPI003559ABC5|nr:hypothetical protein MONOS_18252 [Monocercomonoides exilis]